MLTQHQPNHNHLLHRTSRRCFHVITNDGRQTLIRKLSANIAIYGLGGVLVKFVTFFTIPIYTRLLSVEEYGIWNLMVTASAVLFAMLALGASSVYLRYFFMSDELEERRKVTSTWFGFLTVWSTGVVLLVLPFSGGISTLLTGVTDYALVVALTLLSLPIGLINSLLAQVLVNEFRAKASISLNVLTAILTLLLNVGGFLLFGILGFFVATIAVNLIMLPIRLWTVRHLLRWRFSGSLLIEMLRYGVPIVPSSLAVWVFMSSDRVLLSNLSSLQQVGLYALANQIASLLNLVISALQQAWTPQAVQIYETQPEQAAQVYGRVLSYILIVFGLLCVGVSAFGREIVTLLSSAAYYDAAAAVGPLALGFFAYASAQITHLGIVLKKKTVYLAAFSWLAAIINIILNILWIPQFGFVAAAWSTAIAYGCWTIGFFFVSRRLIAISYETRRLVPIMVFTVGFVTATPLLPQADGLSSVAMKSLYCFAYAALLIMFGAIDQRELGVVSSTLQQLKARVTS